MFENFLKISKKTSLVLVMMKTLDLDSGNFLKTLPYRVKTNTYVAYMLKLILLTVIHFEKFASCVDDPAKCLLFVSRIQHYKLFGFK